MCVRVCTHEYLHMCVCMYVYIYIYIDQALQRTEMNPRKFTADLGPCLEKVGYLCNADHACTMSPP